MHVALLLVLVLLDLMNSLMILQWQIPHLVQSEQRLFFIEKLYMFRDFTYLHNFLVSFL